MMASPRVIHKETLLPSFWVSIGGKAAHSAVEKSCLLGFHQRVKLCAVVGIIRYDARRVRRTDRRPSIEESGPNIYLIEGVKLRAEVAKLKQRRRQQYPLSRMNLLCCAMRRTGTTRPRTSNQLELQQSGPSVTGRSNSPKRAFPNSVNTPCTHIRKAITM